MPPNVRPALAPLTLMAVVVWARACGAMADAPPSSRQAVAATYPAIRRVVEIIIVLLCCQACESGGLRPGMSQQSPLRHEKRRRSMPGPIAGIVAPPAMLHLSET